MKLKIEYLKSQNASAEEMQEAIDKMTEKNCLCTILGSTTLSVNGIENKHDQGVTVCAGPNLQWFNKVTSLNEMVDHIYGRVNLISKPDRPNLFLQELKMYLSFYKEELEKLKIEKSKELERKIATFKKNLLEGIQYYKNLFAEIEERFKPMTINANLILDEVQQEIVQL